MSRKPFPTLKEAIDSWYSDKDAPQITITKCDGSTISGHLRNYVGPNIIVEPDDLPDKRITIPVNNIQRVDLTWCEGEPPTIWEHHVTRTAKNTWLFKTISRT